MKYILDTNICIYIIKKKPVQVFEKFKHLPLGSVGISSITYAELAFGVSKSAHTDKNQLALEQFLIPLEIFTFDAYAAQRYGKISAALEKTGTPIGPLDTLIAAHSLSLGFTLVSNN